MAEKKKKQTAEFAKDKNAFASGVSAKNNSVENKEKQKQSGAHQPRDADTRGCEKIGVENSGFRGPFTL